MKEKSLSIKFALLFLLINIFYLCVLWQMPNIYSYVLQSSLMLLTKLWLINLLGFVGIDGFRFFVFLKSAYIFALLFCANIAAFIGLLLEKRWGIRILTYILLSLCIGGFFWPGISYRSTQAMQTYMQRAYNAWVYNYYWQPVRQEYCKNCERLPESMTQYEQALYPQPLPGSYMEARPLLINKFSERGQEAIMLAPAYWGMYRMSSDAFDTTKEMYQILFFLVRILFYSWFIIIPAVLLYSLHKENIKCSLQPEAIQQINGIAHKESFPDLIMENIVSGAIITVAENFGGLGGGLFLNALLVCLCYIGYTLSMKATLKYPKYFWLYGLCYIATPILFLCLRERTFRWLTIPGILMWTWLYLIIYFCCFLGGFKGYKFCKNAQPNGKP